MCKPLVYRSRFTGYWAWDCEEHRSTGGGVLWQDVLWEALFHRHIYHQQARHAPQ